MRIRAVIILLFSMMFINQWTLEGNQNIHFFTSKSHNFVWFRIYKVASTTIRGHLNKNVPDLVHHARKHFPMNYNKGFKFAFVRNPWARAVSCYFGKVVTKNSEAYKECFDKDFEFFIDFINRTDLKKADKHIRLQKCMLPLKKLDFIGKLENFENDFEYVCNKIGIPYEKKHANKSNHKHYSTYYNNRTRKIIAKKYKADIKAFGYQFETPD